MTRRIHRTYLSAAALAVLGVATVLLGSCSLGGESIRDRIETFIGAVNAQNDQGIKDCLDSDAQDYNTAADLSFWNGFYTNRPYTITDFDSGSSSATVEFTGTSGTLDQKFEMTEESGGFFEGTTYSIRRVYNQGDSSPFFY